MLENNKTPEAKQEVILNEAELEDVEKSFDEKLVKEVNEITDAPAPGDGVSKDSEWQQASKDDVDACVDAVKELTKAVRELMDENKKWFKAGRM